MTTKLKAEIRLMKDRDDKFVAVRWILRESEDGEFFSVKDIREYDVTADLQWSARRITNFFLAEDGDMDPSAVSYPDGYVHNTRVRTLAGQVRACLAWALASTTS
jgi:hypothetical protein